MFLYSSFVHSFLNRCVFIEQNVLHCLGRIFRCIDEWSSVVDWFRETSVAITEQIAQQVINALIYGISGQSRVVFFSLRLVPLLLPSSPSASLSLASPNLSPLFHPTPLPLDHIIYCL